jgi:acetyltransferase
VTLDNPTPLDPFQDLLAETRANPLDVFFSPAAVAVIGATETAGSVGRTLLQNLLASPFGGVVYPINPKRSHVLGVKAYPSIAQAPGPVALAVIVIPAPGVPAVLRACAAAGVTGAIIISAGFKETGPAGAALEAEVLAIARDAGIRIVGPNCLGVMSPHTGLNATFAQAMAPPGKVAFLSQSGALLTAVLDHALAEGIGFSAFASLGSMLDVGWGDLIRYLGDDPNTDAIVIYMESVGDARAFLSAAREVALSKPILVIKAGRTRAGGQAAASHTGALTGSDDVLDAAFARAGVLRVDRIGEVFALTETLAKQPLPAGPRLTIVTNAGGPGVLATDALILGGGQLTTLSDSALARLDAALPAHWSHGNPVDVLGDARAERYADALRIAAEDEHSDALLVILTPQAMTEATRTAALLQPYAHLVGKPVLASWMGGQSVADGARLLSEAGIPTFAYPDQAARTFNTLWRYSDRLRALYETPRAEDTASDAAIDHAAVRRILETVRDSGRTILTEAESKAVLAGYGLPTVPTRIATSPGAAAMEAEALGYPVVVKLHSQNITHKSDVGGVRLNLPDADAVRAAYAAIQSAVSAADFDGVTVQPMVRLNDAYELILGASPDPQFGPVLLFGAGGQLVEVLQDRALGLPPLNSTLARRVMEQTRIYGALQGVRGRSPVDLHRLEGLFVRFAQLVIDHADLLKEIDINPLLVSADGMVALDARVVVARTDETLPLPAIRPYASEYVRPAVLENGVRVTLRPIRAEDEPALVRFHEGLSDRTVRLRYFQDLPYGQRIAHERLRRITQADLSRQFTLVAQTHDGQLGGVGRFVRRDDVPDTGRITLVVSDALQNQGLGSALLADLIECARAEGLTRLSAILLPENDAMRRVCERLGFTLEPVGDVVRATLVL